MSEMIDLAIQREGETHTCASWNCLGSKEGKVVDIDVCVVVRHGVDGAVRVAGMIDESCWSAHMHTIAHVLRRTVFLGPFVEFHQVDFLIHVAALVPLVGLFVGDNLSTVGIDELAFLQVLHAAKAPPTTDGLVDL